MASGITLLNPGCGGDDCYPCDCELPTATCELVTESGVRELNWGVAGANVAWIIKSCSGVETRIDLTLSGGSGSGTISPVDQLCSYTVHAENECGEATSQCFIGCAEIDCSSVPECQCIEIPSGLVRDNVYTINLHVTGIVRGRTFTIAGVGSFTTGDIDITGTYGFSFARGPDEFGECTNPPFLPFATPSPLVLHQEYLYTDSFGQDIYAVLAIAAGNKIGSGITPEDEIGLDFYDEWVALTLTETRPCLSSCTCPAASISSGAYSNPSPVYPFDSSEVTASGATV